MKRHILKPSDKAENRLEIVCRGCSMRGRESIWRGYASSISDPLNWEINNSYLTFFEEPKNPFDSNAVKIVCRGEFFGTVGYVGSDYTGIVKEMLNCCSGYRIEVLDTKQIGNKEIKLVVYYK